MQYIDFEWDDGNENKITLRASLEEIESTFYDQRRKRLKTYFNRYKMLARTSSGRYMHIVYQRKAQGTIRVISARDMDNTEKRRYWRK